MNRRLSRLGVVLLGREMDVPMHTYEMWLLLRERRSGWTDRLDQHA
ncbi:hypothetical protein [Fodinicola feengrottensis]|nr:hypothetical protein [Fodinicola feengrottensis]